MNASNFIIKKSTVVSVVGNNTGTEIWVRNENGSESSYLVTADGFRVREGHEITAILFGPHPVALRNDHTHTKIQLLTGEDILGSGPQVQPRSGRFWIFWAFLVLGPGMLVAAIPEAIACLFPGIPMIQNLGDALGTVAYLLVIFGVPFWFVVRPRILRHKFQKLIKAADAVITQMFNQL